MAIQTPALVTHHHALCSRDTVFQGCPSRPTFSLLFLLSLPSRSQPRQDVQTDPGQDGRGGVGKQSGARSSFMDGRRTEPGGLAGPWPSTRSCVHNGHSLSKGVEEDPRAAPAGRMGGSAVSLSCGSMWSKEMPQCHRRDVSGQVRRKA